MRSINPNLSRKGRGFRRDLTLLAVLPLLLTLVVGVSAQQSVVDWMMRAIDDLRKGDNAKAIADLDEAIKLRPDYADGYMMRSNLKTSDDPKGALADLDKFMQLRPTSGQGYYQRAMLRLVNDDTAGSLNDLDATVANGYKEDHVYNLRGRLRMQKGDLKNSLADYNEAIKLNPDNASYYLNRAWVYLAMDNTSSGLSDLNHVIDWYEAGPQKLVLEKQLNATPDASAKAEIAKPDPQTDALPTLDIATQTKNPEPNEKEMGSMMAEAYDHRAVIYSERGNTDAALADFSKSLKLRPSGAAYFGRALELEKKGDLPGALTDVNQSIALMAKCGGCRLERGAILTLQDKKLEAQTDFDVLMKAGYATQTRIDQSIEATRKRLPAGPRQD